MQEARIELNVNINTKQNQNNEIGTPTVKMHINTHTTRIYTIYDIDYHQQQ